MEKVTYKTHVLSPLLWYASFIQKKPAAILQLPKGCCWWGEGSAKGSRL